MSSAAFSFQRALRLASLVLEMVAVIGLLMEMALFQGWVRLPAIVALGLLRFVALVILAFVVLQICHLFIDWRRALLGLLRALVYVAVAAVPLSRLPHSRTAAPSNESQQIAGRSDALNEVTKTPASIAIEPHFANGS